MLYLHFSDLILMTFLLPVESREHEFTTHQFVIFTLATHSTAIDAMVNRVIMIRRSNPAPPAMPATTGSGRPAKKDTTFSIISLTGLGESPEPDPLPLPPGSENVMDMLWKLHSFSAYLPSLVVTAPLDVIVSLWGCCLPAGHAHAPTPR